MKKILLLLIALFPVLFFSCKAKKTKPFSLDSIVHCSAFNETWTGRTPTSDESQEVESALSQPYRYLGGGGQCYAFVSEDGQYVVKFLKKKLFEMPSWMEYFPFKEKKVHKKQQRKHQVFSAFQNSFNDLSSETGILYVHWNASDHLNTPLSFCNEDGKVHMLAMNNLSFVVQKKAELATARIDTLIQQKNSEGAQAAIDKLLQLHVTLSQKGYRNRDPNFRSNYGFVEDKAVIFDVGRIVASSSSLPKNKQLKALPRFKKYLVSNHPELLSYFDSRCEQILE